MQEIYHLRSVSTFPLSPAFLSPAFPFSLPFFFPPLPFLSLVLLPFLSLVLLSFPFS